MNIKQIAMEMKYNPAVIVNCTTEEAAKQLIDALYEIDCFWLGFDKNTFWEERKDKSTYRVKRGKALIKGHIDHYKNREHLPNDINYDDIIYYTLDKAEDELIEF